MRNLPHPGLLQRLRLTLCREPANCIRQDNGTTGHDEPRSVCSLQSPTRLSQVESPPCVASALPGRAQGACGFCESSYTPTSARDLWDASGNSEHQTTSSVVFAPALLKPPPLNLKYSPKHVHVSRPKCAGIGKAAKPTSQYHGQDVLIPLLLQSTPFLNQP